VRILIVDDHEIVREGLRVALAGAQHYDVVGTAHDGRTGLILARRTAPDVAVVDLRLPDMPGAELCRQLRQALPSVKVVILTAYLSEETVRVCLRAGAAAYVTKAAGLAELRATLDRVMDEQSATSPYPAQIVARLHAIVERRTRDALATPQQERVLELAAQGLSNAAIGERMFIAESTVRFHIQNMKAKFSARTKTELIAKALRNGAIAPAAEAYADAYGHSPAVRQLVGVAAPDRR
jgi:DNA-binding NarL/FixJ family response regulator